MRVFNVAMITLAIFMTLIAALPLFGWDFVLIGKGELHHAEIDDSNLHLFMVRSSAFATFATFTLNYLRRRRPLSSVAPLLYFCVWALVFAPAYIYQHSFFQWKQVAFLMFTLTLAVILLARKQKRSKNHFC